MKRDGKQEHEEARIPGARFFDIDEIVDHTKEGNLPHNFPTLDQFNKFMWHLGVKRTDNIVCYDNLGIFTSPRVAFTFRHFGAQNVRVLNGGFPKWVAEGR